MDAAEKELLFIALVLLLTGWISLITFAILVVL